jgi:hypothetical protein
METRLTLKREANKPFTVNIQIWPEVTHIPTHATNKQAWDFERKGGFHSIYTNARWWGSGSEWLIQTVCTRRCTLLVMVRSSDQSSFFQNTKFCDSGGEHTEASCYKQLVSCIVKGQLHETSSQNPDIKKAKSAYRISKHMPFLAWNSV